MIIRTVAFLAVVAIGAGAGLYGTGPLLQWYSANAETDSGASQPQGPSATLVSVGESAEESVDETVSAVGTLMAIQDIELRPLLEGRVAEIGFQSGGRVDAGDLILRLDDRAQRAALKDAQATLDAAESDFRRAEDLNRRNVSSEATLEDARAEMLRAEAALDQAQKALDDTTLTAPFAGHLGVSDIDIGERIGPDTVVTTLDDLSALTVSFTLPERYFTRVETGQPVRLQTVSTEDRTFEGEVTAIDPRISEAARAFTVRAEIDNSERLLTSGMFVDVALVLDERRSLTVPETALITEGNETFLYALNGDVAERRVVRVGERLDGRVEIRGGLPNPGQVVTSGYERLSDGDTVRIAEADDDGETKGEDPASGETAQMSEASAR